MLLFGTLKENYNPFQKGERVIIDDVFANLFVSVSKRCLFNGDSFLLKYIIPLHVLKISKAKKFQ
ncbi:hypothetical protein MASR1M90_23800 [Desulfovibrionales bacterium]